MMVTASRRDGYADGDPLVNRYDADNSGTIDKSEVIQAINDYLFEPVRGRRDTAHHQGRRDRSRLLINLYL